MSKNLTVTLGILILITILHFSSVFFGLYELGIGIDSFQHFLAGIMFAFLWLEIIEKNKKIKIPKKSFIFQLTMLGFVTLGAVIWEIWEFLATELTPTIAENYKFYSPNIGELLKDVICSQVGALIVSFFLVKSKKPSEK